MTVAFLHVCGNLHVEKERLNRYDKEAAIQGAYSRRRRLDRSLSVVDFLIGRYSRPFMTVISDIFVKSNVG